MDIIGEIVQDVHPSSDAELAQFGWDLWPGRGRPCALGLSSGLTLLAGSDAEGNTYGTIFGHDRSGYFGLPIFPPSAKSVGGDLVRVTDSRVAEVRPMSSAEVFDNCWQAEVDECPLVVVLDNGSVLYPSQDSEGNGPGCFWLLGPYGAERLAIMGVG